MTPATDRAGHACGFDFSAEALRPAHKTSGPNYTHHPYGETTRQTWRLTPLRRHP
jgi:hypothetical protein